MKNTLGEVVYMCRKEKKEYMLLKIGLVCFQGELNDKGKSKFRWRIGTGTNAVEDVCRVAFMNSYGLTKYTLDTLCSFVKSGKKSGETVLNDKSNVVASDERHFKEIIEYAALQGIKLSIEQLAALQIPNTPIALETYSWMSFYFSMVGDSIPNSNNEIHLEPTSVLSIYDEYKTEMLIDEDNTSKEYYSLVDFSKLWKLCFPYVKIREFKAVTGKCNTCAHLSDCRRKCNDKMRKRDITYLHALHRTAYMGERLAYSKRREEAKQFPQSSLSFITDGMAQSHCILPHLGNLSSFGSESLSQHLQGVLAHGRGLSIYRTFHTIKNCANLQIHTLLLSIEKVLMYEKKLPPVFYFQFDGGVENTARIVMAMLELLVVKRVFRKIVASRLMVGHTHEDIDAIFGRIWKHMRNMHVLTPQQYKKVLMSCLKRKRPEQFLDVTDIIVIPDYHEYIDRHIDTKFGRYAKGFTFDY
jgi:hypothetical protein